MYSLLLVAFSAAFFAVISTLNSERMEEYAKTQAEQRALRMLIEHDCRSRNVGTNCLSIYDPDNSEFQFRNGGSGSYRCTYTKEAYEKSDAYVSVLARKTMNSYLCVGRKQASRFVPEPGQSAIACDEAPSGDPISTIPNRAVVICQKN
ncbi:MAG: hypothetical protein RIR70_1709 [Pseudomonadota bacterium]|jgi:hypothetical protein